MKKFFRALPLVFFSFFLMIGSLIGIYLSICEEGMIVLKVFVIILCGLGLLISFACMTFLAKYFEIRYSSRWFSIRTFNQDDTEIFSMSIGMKSVDKNCTDYVCPSPVLPPNNEEGSNNQTDDN